MRLFQLYLLLLLLHQDASVVNGRILIFVSHEAGNIREPVPFSKEVYPQL